MRVQTWSVELEFFCDRCKGRLDIISSDSASKVMVVPCPGCLSNAECDGYNQRDDEVKGCLA